MPAKKRPGRPPIKGPMRVLRAIAKGAKTPREASAKARVKPSSGAVYVYRHRKAGLVMGRSGRLRITAEGRTKLR